MRYPLDVVSEWITARRGHVRLVYDAPTTDVYIGFHGGRLVITSSWIAERSPLSNEINVSILIHELAHVLAEPDPNRLKMPNFGMVRYLRPFDRRNYSHLDPTLEILTECKTQAICKSILRGLGLYARKDDPIKVDPVRALEGLPFTGEQSAKIISDYSDELDRLAADPDTLEKIEERIAQA